MSTLAKGTVFLVPFLLMMCAPSAMPPIHSPVEINGKRPLALIVGVNDYAKKNIKDLRGAVKDADHIAALLKDPGGYGFPEENILLLKNKRATLANFRTAFRKGLLERARPGDPVLIYFSGHGSHFPDINGDEDDDLDETLLFHNSTRHARFLSDDELNVLLRELYQITTEICVVIDACHSGTATRAEGEGVRYVPPAGNAPRENAQVSSGREDLVLGNRRYCPAEMPEVVVFSAAKDGTHAFDTSNGGLFSMALIKSLARLSSRPLTYVKVEDQVRSALGHTRQQLPDFQGNRNKPVFGQIHRKRPLVWKVIKPGKDTVTLTGTVLPGMSPGAEVRVYPPDTNGLGWLDPQKSRADLIVKAVNGFHAEAVVDGLRPGQTIREGDLATLIRPGDDACMLTLRIRPATEAEGVPDLHARELREYIDEDPEAKHSIKLLDASRPDSVRADLEVIFDRNETLHLLDRDGYIRGSFSTKESYAYWYLVETLWKHARIEALLALNGDGGHGLRDGESIVVELVSAEDSSRVLLGERTPSGVRRIPLCKNWRVRIRLAEEVTQPLFVAGFLLSADGTIFTLPRQGPYVLIKPGQSHLFDHPHETFRIVPSPGLKDHLAFFGSPTEVAWKQAERTARNRRLARGVGVENSLFRRLDRYLSPGRRRSGETFDSVSDSVYVQTILSLETTSEIIREDNPEEVSLLMAQHTPDDPNHPWAKVLARTAREIGPVHDSAAAMAAVFQDVVPPDETVTAVDLLTGKGAWASVFTICKPTDPWLPGDIVVMHDLQIGEALALLVIDPVQRMGWGAQTWSSDEKEGEIVQPEYKPIPSQKYWAEQGRSQVRLTTRLRHPAIQLQGKTNRLGRRALRNYCQ